MSGILRLKMQVTSVHRTIDDNGNTAAENITLGAAINAGEDNANWTNTTPIAHMQFVVNNPDAFGKILPKQFYLCDMVLAEVPAPGFMPS